MRVLSVKHNFYEDWRVNSVWTNEKWHVNTRSTRKGIKSEYTHLHKSDVKDNEFAKVF